jgi:hypothetical protein
MQVSTSRNFELFDPGAPSMRERRILYAVKSLLEISKKPRRWTT